MQDIEYSRFTTSLWELRSMKAGKWTSLIIVYLLSMVVVHAVVLWQVRSSISQGYGDFAAFYTAGKLVRQGRSAELYDRRAQWQVQQEFASKVKIRSGPLPYIRPPFEALLFLPLTYLQYPAAWVIWTALKIGVLFVIPFLLASFQGRGCLPPLSEGILCLGFAPVAFDLLLGQDSILLLLVMVLSFRAFQGGKDLRSGVFLALGLFKFHLVIPIFLVLLLKGKIKAVLGFLSAGCGLLLISASLVGWKGVFSYPKYLWDLNHSSGVGLVAGKSMPNFHGVIAAIFGSGNVPGWIDWFLIALTILGIVFTAGVWRSNNRDFRLVAAGLSLAIVVTIFTSTYAGYYDLTLLILPILLLSGDFLQPAEIHGWSRIVLLACVAALAFSPLYWLLILRFDQFYWMALVLFLLSASLARTVQIRQATLIET